MAFESDEFETVVTYSSRIPSKHNFSEHSHVHYSSDDRGVFYRLYPRREKVSAYKIQYSEYSIPYKLRKTPEGLDIALFIPNNAEAEFCVDLVPANISQSNRVDSEGGTGKIIGTVVITGLAEYHNVAPDQDVFSLLEDSKHQCCCSIVVKLPFTFTFNIKGNTNIEKIEFYRANDLFIISIPKRSKDVNSGCTEKVQSYRGEFEYEQPKLQVEYNENIDYISDCSRHHETYPKHTNTSSKGPNMVSVIISDIPLPFVLGVVLLVFLVLIYWIHSLVSFLFSLEILSIFSGMSSPSWFSCPQNRSCTKT
ncbi:hypothetical protein BB560_001512 [Smittium megazygosporum]|uniref:Uncharacterized protein n=1 Tax=Smittium megazygosporum TaxID=133381 RepID=A0A2T9ZHK8_9FUNG|nr:hypothetical protein BB560_001512 [Smittium megazygosporum]